MNEAEIIGSDRASTGIEGLDYILKGGLSKNRLYLVQGNPGTGKTTMGLQFLLEGERKGEKGALYNFVRKQGRINCRRRFARLEFRPLDHSRFDRLRRYFARRFALYGFPSGGS